MKVPLVKDNITKENIDALCEWLQSGENPPRLSQGEIVKEIEETYAFLHGRKYAVFCNSGSSANLLAVAALRIQNKLKNNRVVVPSLGWATTLSPWMINNFIILPCDNDSETLGIDVSNLEEIFKKDDPAVLMTVNTLGFPNEYSKIQELCEKHGVVWINDDCEGCWGEFENKTLQQYGDIVTQSFFISHFLNSCEGGLCLTDNRELYNYMRMAREHGWARNVEPEYKEFLENEYKIDKFNANFTFYTHHAYNLRGTDINAFILREQLKNWEFCRSGRTRVYELYDANLKNSYWKVKPLGNLISPFAYPVITDKRPRLVEHLIENEIETRPLISGDLFSQPMYTDLFGESKMVFGKKVYNEGLYLPIRPDMTEEEVKFVCEKVNEITNV